MSGAGQETPRLCQQRGMVHRCEIRCVQRDEFSGKVQWAVASSRQHFGQSIQQQRVAVAGVPFGIAGAGLEALAEYFGGALADHLERLRPAAAHQAAENRRMFGRLEIALGYERPSRRYLALDCVEERRIGRGVGPARFGPSAPTEGVEQGDFEAVFREKGRSQPSSQPLRHGRLARARGAGYQHEFCRRWTWYCISPIASVVSGQRPITSSQDIYEEVVTPSDAPHRIQPGVAMIPWKESLETFLGYQWGIKRS